MADFKGPTHTRSAIPSNGIDLAAFAFDRQPVCWLHHGPLTFNPPGLRTDVDPYEGCSPVAAAVEQEFPWLQACRAEAEAADSMGIAGELRLVAHGLRSLAPKLTRPRGALELVKREPPPRNAEPGSRGKPSADDIARNAAHRDHLLRSNSEFQKAENNPWRFFHCLGDRFPIVEKRQPGASMAEMIVYDRAGRTPIWATNFPVSVVRKLMNVGTKDALRAENVPTLETLIANHSRAIAEVENMLPAYVLQPYLLP